MTDRFDQQWQPQEVIRLLTLVEGERRYYQEMIAGLPVPLAILGHDRHLVYANNSFRTTFSLQGQEIRQKSIHQILPGGDLEDALDAARTARSVEPIVLSDGDRVVRVSILPVTLAEDGSDADTILLAEDLTDLLPSLKEGSSQAAVAEVAPPFPLEIAGVVWEANPGTLSFERVWGDCQGLLGLPAQHWLETQDFFEQRIHPEDRDSTLALYRSAMAAGEDATAEFRALSASGAVVWCRETIRVTPSPSGRLMRGVVTDFTERKSIEQQMLTGARHEALRELSGRLAHNLNNPLMVVSGYQEELLASTPKDSPVHADLSEMATANQRLSEVASRLTEFVQAGASPAEPVDLRKLLDSLGEELVRIAGLGTTVETISTSPAAALANRDQLSGVVLALSAGVREGAAERTTVSVSCFSQRRTERVAGALLPGKYACLHIRDNGRGVDEKHRATMFEGILPDKDRTGSSRALQRAYAVVREWGGDILVESSPGNGTAFTIFLPHVPEPDAPPLPQTQPEVVSPPSAVQEQASSAPSGPATSMLIPDPPEAQRETILIVDDEPGIRSLVRKILRRERYRVLEAGSAEEAIAIAGLQNSAIRLLLTDVMLPGLDGPELARRMCETTPGLKVLYISGYSPEETAKRTQFPQGANFLAKPFTLGALVSSVRSTLDA